MKTITPRIAVLFLLMISMTSCEVIGDIFKAGMWVGILIVAVIIGLIFWIISKVGGKK